MQKKLILLLIFMVLIAVFALQNSLEVEIKLWFWSVRTSMVLVLILTFAAGAIAGILFSLPRRSKKSGRKETRPAEPSPGQVPSEGNDVPPGDEFEDVIR
jgi:uncharacterized integral membrane protein